MDNGRVMPAPSLGGMVTSWTLQPVAVAAVAALAFWYARAALRAPGTWSARRSAAFAGGLAAGLWLTCGFPGRYAPAAFWMWTSQQLALLLIVPILLLSGRPLQLARLRSGDHGIAARVLRSRVVRVLGNPLIGPAIIPLLCTALFFGPLPRWCVEYTAGGWIEQLVVVLAGALVVLPLVGTDATPSSLRVGLILAIGSFELVLDAIPGIALRLHRSLSTSYFDQRIPTVWAPAPLHDQQIAGAVLWCVAELIDLPFLVLVFRQWIRADAREAAEADAVLEAERIALTGDSTEASRDRPWWLSDPAMRDRLKRPD